MAVSDYKTNPDENTTISGINIAEGCPPSGINNAIRQLMADVKQNADEQSTEFSKVMTGATASVAGKSGNVPAPSVGDQNKPLTGGGKYADSLDCDITGNAASSSIAEKAKYSDNSGHSNSSDVSNKLSNSIQLHLTGAVTGDSQYFGAGVDGNNSPNLSNKIQYIGGSAIQIFGSNSNKITLPAGGTWNVIGVEWSSNGDYTTGFINYTTPGGTTITRAPSTVGIVIACFRVQ